MRTRRSPQTAGRPTARTTRRRRAGRPARWLPLGARVGAGAAGCSLLVGLVAGADAEPPVRVDLQGGAAWVASATVGQMTLIDGGSAEVVATVAVSGPGVDLTAAQAGLVGYGVDRDHGTVARIDPTTFVAGPSVAVIDGARGDVSAHPSGDVVYVVDNERGRVGVADAGAVSSLQGEVQSLAEPVTSSVVDDDGRLWTLGATTGDLTWFDRTERHSRPAAVADPAHAELVVVDGRAALVERDGRSVRTLDDGGGLHRSSCIDIDPADTTVVVGGSPRSERLYVVSGDDGLLRVSDLDTGRCGDVAVEIAGPGSTLGAPQEAQDRVFVPDHTTGTVVVVDLGTRESVRTAGLVAPGTPFQLLEEDGIVFYNDPASERAGVVDIDGSFTPVAKYDPDRPDDALRGHDDADDETASTDGARDAGGTGSGAAGGVDGAPDERGAPLTPDGADQPGDQATGGGARQPEAAGSSDPAQPAPGDAPLAANGPTDPNGPLPPNGPGVDPPPGPGGRGPTGRLAIVAPAARVLVGDPLDLGARTTDGTGISDVTWTFGDGTTGTGEATTHSWDAAGSYVVTAVATLETGESARAEATIGVVDRSPDPLVAGFGASVTSVEVGSPVTFTDQSQGIPTSWSWTFEGATGTGTSPLQRPPPQTWDSPGSYTVTLTVVRDGDSDTHSRDITVTAPPAPAPQVAPIALGSGNAPPYDDQTEYEFFTLVSGRFTSCTWTIEGAAIPCSLEPGGVPDVTRAEVRHRFTAGTRTVQVDVGWSGGTVTESLTVDVTTPPPPTVPLAARFDWSPTAIEVGQPVTFVDRSTGPPDAWSWTFAGARDSGTSSAQSPPPQVWYTAGQHTVTLTVRRGGETDTWSAVITVAEPPAGTPMLGRIGTTTAPPPYNTVTDYTFDVTIAGDFTSCTWTVEGIDRPCTLEASHGPGLTQAEVVHRFGSPGTKTVRITVGWSGGTVTDSEIFEVV